MSYRGLLVSGRELVRAAERIRLPLKTSLAVVVQLDASPQLVATMLGILSCGGIPILWPPRVRLPDWLVRLPRILLGPKAVTSTGWAREVLDARLSEGDDARLNCGTGIGVCSSGTTGRGKTVIVDCARALENAAQICERLRSNTDGTIYSLRHPAYSSGLVGDLMVGALLDKRIEFLPISSLGLAIRKSTKSWYGSVHGTPDAVRRFVLSIPRCRIQRAVISGAAVPSAMVGTLLDKGVEVWVGYGLSEAGPRVAMFKADASYRFGDCGLPLDRVKVEVICSEVVIVSAYIALAVLDDRGERPLTLGRHLNTGDKGTLNCDGTLSVTGRLSDCITVGDVAVVKTELEETLRDEGVEVISVKSKGNRLLILCRSVVDQHVKNRSLQLLRGTFPFLPRVEFRESSEERLNDSGKVLRL